MAEHQGSSGLFAIFILSIYSLFLIPYTIYYFCSAEENASTQPVAKGKKKRSSLSEYWSRYCTKGNITLLVLWLVWFAILFYVQLTTSELKPFDPFEILGVDSEASEKDIKKAYRKLSLQYHPDKNPDPKAASYFTEYISKAYAALTDDVSRKNYEKYGHPDGPQGINIGVALPEWMFSKDRKAAPLMLIALVGCGILLPLSVISWYMLSSNKYSGPNRIMNETFLFFLQSKFCVKESQSLVRIPETLMCAMEFITMYTPSEHNAPFEELRKLVAPRYPELMAKDKKAFWQRKASVVKAHMLFLAHLERLDDEVPAALKPDLAFVLQKTPLLLEEIVKIALLPRPPVGYGWMTPAIAAVEMMQCVAQGINTNSRKPQGKSGDNMAPLLQLPHFDTDVIKKLKKKKVNNLSDLQDQDESARAELLTGVGLSEEAVDDVTAFLSAFPELAVAARCEVDGEDEIMEQDPIHCRVRVLLSRPSHACDGFSLKGSAVRAYTPQYPHPRDESWYVFLTDPGNNAVLAWQKVNLMEAEKEGLKHPEAFKDQPDVSRQASTATANGTAANGDTKSLVVGNQAANGYSAVAGSEQDADDQQEQGQEVDLVFPGPKPGKYDLQLVIMSDCWMGADVTQPIKLKVAPLTRAVAEGRDMKSKAAAKQWDSDDEEAEVVDRKDKGDAEDEDGDEEEEEDEEDDDDYDSDETGEEESDGETEQ